MSNRTCLSGDSDTQATAAAAKGYTHSFAFAYVQVKTHDAASNEVTFSATGSTTLYKVSWTDPDVWPGCPTTIDVPEAGTEGTLLIGARIYDDHSFDAARPYATRLKWPIEGDMSRFFKPDEITGYSPLMLDVNRIDITAAPPGQSSRLEFDLFAQDCNNNELDLRHFTTTLNIKARKAEQCTLTELQILHAVIYGTNPRTGISDTVDLRDPLMSDPFQIIDLITRPKLSVRLSERGLFKFGEGSPELTKHSGQSTPLTRY